MNANNDLHKLLSMTVSLATDEVESLRKRVRQEAKSAAKNAQDLLRDLETHEPETVAFSWLVGSVRHLEELRTELRQQAERLKELRELARLAAE